MTVARGVLVAMFLLAAAPASAAACTVTWDDGAGDRLWRSGANWSGNAVPGTAAEVCIGPLSGARIVVDTDVAVATVETAHPVEAREAFTAALVAGDFVLADGASLVDATVGEATVRVPGGASARMVGGELAEGSLVDGDGDFVIAATAPGGRRRATTSTAWTGGSMGGGGATIVEPGASLVIDPGPPPPGSEFPITTGTADRRQLSNNGTMTWQSGRIVIGDNSAFDNNGTLSLASPSDRWTGSGTSAIVNTGVIAKSGTNTVDFPAVDNDGTIRVSRGELLMDSLLQTVDGRIEVTLGGTAAQTQHGVVSAHSLVGTARLAGTLAVTLNAGYAPAEGDVFEIVRGAVVKGAFTAFDGLSLEGGLDLVPSYTPTAVSLTATSTEDRAAAGSVSPPPVAIPGDSDGAVPPISPAETPLPGARPQLLARDDDVRRRARRRVRLRGILANDVFPPGTRVELSAPPRGVAVRLNARTGSLRLRLRSARPRFVLLRYRLVAPDGHRSPAAAVRIRLRGR